jgi:hypothetical protein
MFFLSDHCCQWDLCQETVTPQEHQACPATPKTLRASSDDHRPTPLTYHDLVKHMKVSFDSDVLVKAQVCRQE